MRAIILAAGRGSRLGSLTNNQPKCMTKLHGKMLIEWQLDALSHAGIPFERISIITGYLKDSFNFPLTYFENKIWNKSNMVRTLLSADEWLSSTTCIVSYSDIVYKSDVIEKLINDESCDITITYDHNWKRLWKMRFENPLDDAETFKIDDNFYLQEIGKKTENINNIEGQYMGLLKITPNGWKSIKDFLRTLSDEEINLTDCTSLLNGLIQKNTPIKAIAIDQNWYEVDNAEDLKAYESLDALW